MLLLTIYIFRKTFNISSNGNRKYLLASLRANFPYSVSTFVQQKKMGSLQLGDKIASFSPLPSVKNHNKIILIQLHIQNIPFLLHQLWIKEIS